MTLLIALLNQQSQVTGSCFQHKYKVSKCSNAPSSLCFLSLLLLEIILSPFSTLACQEGKSMLKLEYLLAPSVPFTQNTVPTFLSTLEAIIRSSPLLILAMLSESFVWARLIMQCRLLRS